MEKVYIGLQTDNFLVLGKNSDNRWVCQCKCGQTVLMWGRKIHTQKCCSNCQIRGKYGLKSKHYLYKTWRNIWGRCYCRGQTHWHYYGGRGIAMYPAWKTNYEAFYDYIIKHLGERPTVKHTIDRTDPAGDYAPGNLRWASKSEQCKNKNKRYHLVR